LFRISCAVEAADCEEKEGRKEGERVRGAKLEGEGEREREREREIKVRK
jgi:hypothetical protein